MKKFLLFLLMTTPLFTWAQVDDMYYVPKKEKKVLHVKSAEEVYFADDNTDIVEDSLVYVDEDCEGYYTNDLYDVMDDYTYSNRIIRFQSPRRMFVSDIYWDMMYGCGINDWYVYDNGYTLYIYPTGNNPYFMSPGYYHWMNRWNWNSCYYDYYYPYYSWHNYHPYYGWHNYHHHWHTPVASHKPWKPKYRENIPTNGSVTKPTRQTVPTMAGGNSPRRQQPTRTTANGNNPRRQQPTRTTANDNNPRRQQPARTTANDNNPRRQQPTRTTANDNNPRRQQPARTTTTSGNKQRREQKVRTSVNSSNARRSANSSNEERAVRRSSGNSSGGYSRPSSTSVSRSGSSYSSGGGNRSSGGSSRSGGNSGGSRSGGGGARSGGSRR